MVRSTLGLFMLLVAAACGSNGSSSGPCDVIPPDPACNLTCDPQPGAPASCPDGFYCNPDGKCYAQCSQGGDECGDGYTCTYDGHCQPGDPGMGSGSGSNDCPRVAFSAKPVTPSVLLLIDRSGSMKENFAPGVDKWQAVQSALVNTTTGVVTQLESKAYFGALIYDTANGVACPRLASVPRALNNAAMLRTALETRPQDGSTPTAKSIDAAVASFAAIPPPAGSPPLIVLATDGVPYVCNQGQTDDRPETVRAAGRAYTAGIKLIPLSVGNAVGDQHLQEVANAGNGVQAGQPNAKFYKGNSPAELKAAFDQIIGGAVTCDLTVNASVTEDQASRAEINLNGRALAYGTDWELVGDRTIRIKGAACDMMKASANPMVDGTFPCGVVLE